jgi:hypothetical protein
MRSTRHQGPRRRSKNSRLTIDNITARETPMRLTKHLARLATATALLAARTVATHADAAPPGAPPA